MINQVSDGGSRISVEAITADPPPIHGRVVLRQRWCQLGSFHWRYRPQEVQALLPPGVVVDTFDGSAWVGLIPFMMRDVAIGPTPPVPWFGTFVEINVRTYVVDPRGRRTVWFFSLDVPRATIVAVARSVFALPYCWADAEHVTEGPRHEYRMRRRWPLKRSFDRATADIRFTVGEPIPSDEEGPLDHFLSARWALLTSRRNHLLYGRVEHQRWPLCRVGDLSIDQTVIEAAGLSTPSGSVHALYAPAVDVRIPWIERIDVSAPEAGEQR